MTTGPIDTIREALTDAHPGPMPEHDPMCRIYSGYPETRAKGCNCSVSRNAAALAALTEVEHQLRGAEAARDTLLREISEDYVLAGAYHEQQARAVAAETALAEANHYKREMQVAANDALARAEAAEQRANDQLKIAQNTYELLVQAKRERNDLADALRARLEAGHNDTCDVMKCQPTADWQPTCSCGHDIARAALDRHTHQDKAVERDEWLMRLRTREQNDSRDWT